MADTSHHRKQGFGLVCWVLIGLARQEGLGGRDRKEGAGDTEEQELPTVTKGLPRLPTVNKGYQRSGLKAELEGGVNLGFTTANKKLK